MSSFQNIPNLYLVGAPKCGTTTLSNFLSSHPQIFAGHIKEPFYWSSDMPFFAHREGVSHYSDYLAIYAAAPNETKYCLDSSTHYLYSKVAAKRIMSAVENSKFIVCFRPQHELAIAWHMQMCNAGYEDIKDFRKAWDLRKIRRNGEKIPKCCPEPLLLDYESVASVGDQMARMLSHVDAANVFVISLEHLKSNPEDVLNSCMNFLGLKAEITEPLATSNPAFVNRSAVISRFIRLPVVRRGTNAALSIVPSDYRKKIKRTVRFFLYKTQERQELDEGFLEDLKNEFKEDSEKLSDCVRLCCT